MAVNNRKLLRFVLGMLHRMTASPSQLSKSVTTPYFTLGIYQCARCERWSDGDAQNSLTGPVLLGKPCVELAIKHFTTPRVRSSVPYKAYQNMLKPYMWPCNQIKCNCTIPLAQSFPHHPVVKKTNSHRFGGTCLLNGLSWIGQCVQWKTLNQWLPQHFPTSPYVVA